MWATLGPSPPMADKQGPQSPDRTGQSCVRKSGWQQGGFLEGPRVSDPQPAGPLASQLMLRPPVSPQPLSQPGPEASHSTPARPLLPSRGLLTGLFSLRASPPSTEALAARGLLCPPSQGGHVAGPQLASQPSLGCSSLMSHLPSSSSPLSSC